MIVPLWTKKRSLFVATIFLVLLGSVFYVQGYGTGQATLFGHSAEEVDVMYGGRLITLHRALYEIEQAIIALMGGNTNMTSFPLDPSSSSSSHAGLQSMEGHVYITALEGRYCWYYIEFNEQLVLPYTQTQNPCGGRGCLQSSRLQSSDYNSCHNHIQWFLRDTLTKDIVSYEIAGMPVSYFALEDYTLIGRGINPRATPEATFTFKYAMTTSTPGDRFKFSCNPTEDAYESNGEKTLCAASSISFPNFQRCCERRGALGPWPRYE